MSDDSFQDTLFEDPIGLRFRHAREKARWSLEAVAQQLKLPMAVLDAIEKEDWARLGAPIFVRSYLGSYAKLLGLPPSIADEVIKGKPQPQLSAVGNVPPRRRLDRRLGNLARFAVTIALLVAVAATIWYLQGKFPGAAPEGAPGVLVPIASPGPSVAAMAPVAPAAADSLSGDSMQLDPTSATLGATVVPSTAGAGELVLRFRGDSWVEVLGPDGVALERGLVAAGAERRYAPGRASRVMLGDAAAVQVFSGGSPLDLSPYRTAKLARFTVSSDGSLHPALSD